MRLSFATLLAAVLVVSEVSASVISRPNHARLARRMARKKRCVQRQTLAPGDYDAQPTTTSTQVAAPEPTPENNNNDNGNNGNDNGNNNSGGSPQGTIQAWSDVCGSPDASQYPTNDNGPNGRARWLTCNIDSSGWVPPPVTLQNIVYKSLGEALDMPGNPFGPCREHLGSFQYWGQQLGIPDILLASIALQESTCRSWVTGPNGEIGLMQITPEKCRGDCYEPGNNIMLGGQFLAGVIQQMNGNLAESMGYYNGWFRHMTIYDANNHPTCGSRNNLDYLQNVFNGYMQGVDPYSLNMGTFFNNRC